MIENILFFLDGALLLIFGINLSAAFAGIAGVLYSFSNYTVQSMKFGYNYSIEILVMVVLGGMGNILGSVISATVLYVLPEAMRSLYDFRMIVYAVVLIVVMLCTWSPKVKSKISAFTANAKNRLFRKKEVGEDA